MADKNRTTVLFVTRDEHLKNTVKADLERNNHRFVLASNDSEARLKVVGEIFQFVIIDMGMDGFDSTSFIHNIRHKEKLKKLTNLLPIIMFGEDEEHFNLTFKDLEKVSYLSKPLEFDELKVKLAILDGRNIIKENTKEIKKGICIIEEGTASNEMYWVLKGSFITTIKSDNDDKFVGRINEGELIGEMSFLDNNPRSATVTSLEDSEVLVIPYKKFVHAVDGQPKWFQALMRTLSIRLRKSNYIISGKAKEETSFSDSIDKNITDKKDK